MNARKIAQTLSALRIGDLFKFSGRSKVYVYDGRQKGKYCYYDFEDINDFHCTKVNRYVETEFEY